MIQREDFDARELQRELAQGDAAVGAVVSFVGVVRGEKAHGESALRESGEGARRENARGDGVCGAGTDGGGDAIHALTLEHYPGMTEANIQAIIDEARQRWPLRGARVVHRVGRLAAGEQIVFAGVAAAHRGDAFQACEFIMDYLKTRAPFWKKETGPAGDYWVEARGEDETAADRWRG